MPPIIFQNSDATSCAFFLPCEFSNQLGKFHDKTYCDFHRNCLELLIWRIYNIRSPHPLIRSIAYLIIFIVIQRSFKISRKGLRLIFKNFVAFFVIMNVDLFVLVVAIIF